MLRKIKYDINKIELKTGIKTNELSISSNALVISNPCSITFMENKKIKHVIKIDEHVVYISRLDKMTSNIHFELGKPTDYFLNAGSKKLHLHVETQKLHVDNDNIHIVYQTEIDKEEYELHEIVIQLFD